MHHGTVSSADRLSQGVIAWPQSVRRIPTKTSKNRKKEENPKKIGACGGPWDPISPPHGYPLGPPRPPRAAVRAASGENPSLARRSSGCDVFLSSLDAVSGPGEHSEWVKHDMQSTGAKNRRAKYHRAPTPQSAHA